MSLSELPRAKPWSGSQAGTRKNFRWWYEALIDWQICNPSSQLNEAAKFFGRSVTTISLIVNSDIYKIRLAQRRKEHSANLTASVIEKTTKIANQALDIISERLQANPEKMPTGMLVDMADKALDRLGYGQQPQAQAGPNVTVVVPISAQVLADARSKIRQIESTAVEVAPEGRGGNPVLIEHKSS